MPHLVTVRPAVIAPICAADPTLIVERSREPSRNYRRDDDVKVDGVIYERRHCGACHRGTILFDPALECQPHGAVLLLRVAEGAAVLGVGELCLPHRAQTEDMGKGAKGPYVLQDEGLHIGQAGGRQRLNAGLGQVSVWTHKTMLGVFLSKFVGSV